MRHRILVVDDEAPSREMLGSLLESVGYSCALAGDMSEARASLASEPFDLLLADVSMPGQSGLEIVVEARERYPDTAVVMVAGLDDPQLAARAVELGSYGYILKPVERTEVVMTVLNALRRRKLELESRAVQQMLQAQVEERTVELEHQARALRHRNRQLALVQRVNRELSGHLLLSELLPALASGIRPLFRLDSIVILGVEAPGTAIVLEAWPSGIAAVGDRLGLEGARVGAVVRSGRRAALSAAALRRPDGQWACRFFAGLHRAVVLPLSAGGGQAVLCLGSRSPGKLSGETLDLLEMVAAQVAVALANSRTVRSLEDLSRQKSEFVAIASHELRTPLTTIKGYAKLLLTPGFADSEEERHGYLERLYAGTDRLSKLVEDLMQAARLEGGQPGLRQDRVRLRSVLRQLGPLLADRYGESPLLPRGDRAILGDAIAVERVLNILLDNAFKYREGAAVPEVRWRRSPPPGRVGVEVVNVGPSLPADEMDRLFKRFGRLTRHTDKPGSGFGLYAARMLMGQMGGGIGVECKGGKVVFWVEFPAPPEN